MVIGSIQKIPDISHSRALKFRVSKCFWNNIKFKKRTEREEIMNE